MPVPVFPLLVGVAGAAVAACGKWYEGLSSEDKAKVNRALIKLMLFRFGKAAEELNSDDVKQAAAGVPPEEARAYVAQISREKGGPIVN